MTNPDITNAQIRALREEAIAASDYRMADICSVALASREDHDEQTAELLVGPDGEPMTRTEARSLCAAAIKNGQGQED